jgi:small subunit ribosomal protein S17
MANNRRRLIGRVVSNKMEKTVVVSIDINKQHRIYKKVVRVSKKVYAHDESNAIPLGSLVRLVESKPLSKLKRWVVEEVIQDTTGKVLEPISGDITEEPGEEAQNDSD